MVRPTKQIRGRIDDTSVWWQKAKQSICASAQMKNERVRGQQSYNTFFRRHTKHNGAWPTSENQLRVCLTARACVVEGHFDF